MATNAVPIAAGFVLFGENLPHGTRAVLQIGAFACLVASAVAQPGAWSTAGRPSRPHTLTVPGRARIRPEQASRRDRDPGRGASTRWPARWGKQAERAGQAPWGARTSLPDLRGISRGLAPIARRTATTRGLGAGAPQRPGPAPRHQGSPVRKQGHRTSCGSGRQVRRDDDAQLVRQPGVQQRSVEPRPRVDPHRADPVPLGEQARQRRPSPPRPSPSTTWPTRWRRSRSSSPPESRRSTAPAHRARTAAPAARRTG